MADGGGSSAGAAGGSDGGQAASSGAAAGQSSVAAGETAVAEDAGETVKADSKESKTAKVGAVVDDKAVTVKEATDKSTINKDHVEGEEKPKEVKEEKEVKTHKYHDRLSKAYPGRAFADDGEYESAHEELVTDLLGYKDRGTKANEKLIGLFEAEPQVADIVRSMINGETFRAAVARHISAEDLAVKPGDPDYEAWDKNTKDRIDRAAKTELSNKEFSDNIEFSQKSIDEFAKENNMKPEDAEDLMGKVLELLQPVYKGRLSKDTLAMLRKAIEFDSKIIEAKEEGGIAEKNKKVIAEKEKIVDGDGIPHMKKSGGEEQEEIVKPEGQTIIDRITEGAKKRQIF